MTQRTMTVSELIEAISAYKSREDWPDNYRFEQHWIACLKQSLYNGGFREEDWNADEGDDLDDVLSEAFDDALRKLHRFAPVTINEDREES